MQQRQGPLAGVKVVELSTFAAGPSAGAVLGDWGAEVLKVESPEGDPFRFMTRFDNSGGEEYTTSQLDNRGKRSLSVDLKHPQGAAILGELIAGADVFLTNVRVQALRKLGFDDETLLARHPRLIYALLTGYGLAGPDKDRPAFDAGTWWGRAGVAMTVLSEGAEPFFHAGAIGDHFTGFSLASGVCAALFARERSGKGQRVDVSMLRTGAFFIASNLYGHLSGKAHPKQTRYDVRNMLVMPYRTLDAKWIFLLGNEGDVSWVKLSRSLDRPEWADDPRYKTADARVERRGEVVRVLDEIFATRTRADWAERLDREGMWWAPVQTVDELPQDPQMRAAGCFVKVPTRWGEREMVPAPVDFGGTPWSTNNGSPAVGEHSDEVLRELGRSAAEIERLRTARIIR
jgi:crotonobetainyl-CoA:carnitine CoA-transferase CaiB-like acyl-CoA transferase